MNETENQPQSDRDDAARAEGGALDAEALEELVAIARDAGAEVPVGAEGFASALRAVADQRDEYLSRLQRTAADYQNFQRRATNNEREARQLAAAGVVQSVVSVVDYFDMALRQNPATATVDQVMGGVRMIKSELLRVLSMHGVGVVEPARGEAFDPVRHEAIEQTESAEVEPGRVLEVRAPGYTLGDRVIRPAKVTVARAATTQEAPPSSGE